MALTDSRVYRCCGVGNMCGVAETGSLDVSVLQLLVVIVIVSLKWANLRSKLSIFPQSAFSSLSLPSFVSSVPENLITDCMQDMTAGITMQARTTHFLAHDEYKWDMNMSLSLPSPSHLLLLSE